MMSKKNNYSLNLIIVLIAVLFVFGCSNENYTENEPASKLPDSGGVTSAVNSDGVLIVELQDAPKEASQFIAEIGKDGNIGLISSKFTSSGDLTLAELKSVPFGIELTLTIKGYANKNITPTYGGPVFLQSMPVIMDAGVQKTISISGSGCQDADKDGYGVGCQTGPDCDESDPSRFQILWGYQDIDQDGYGAGEKSDICTGKTLPAHMTDSFADDCNDLDPNAWHIINAYPDRDGDGYGYCDDDPTDWCIGVNPAPGTSDNNKDCDDHDASKFDCACGSSGGGGGGTTNCEDLDNDGYGENCANGPDCNNHDASVWRIINVYPDRDGDGYGFCDDDPTDWCIGVNPAPGTSDNNKDCDDHDATVFDCTCGSNCQDLDNDGYGVNCPNGPDCNEHDASVWRIVNVYPDRDGDGYGYCDDDPTDWCIGVNPAPGTSDNNMDCNDHDATVFNCGCGTVDGDTDNPVTDGDTDSDNPVTDGDTDTDNPVIDGDTDSDNPVIDGDVDPEGCGICPDYWVCENNVCVDKRTPMKLTCYDYMMCQQTCFSKAQKSTCYNQCKQQGDPLAIQIYDDILECGKTNGCNTEPTNPEYIYTQEFVHCATSSTACSTEIDALTDCAYNWTCDPVKYNDCLDCGGYYDCYQNSSNTLECAQKADPNAMMEFSDIMTCFQNLNIGSGQMMDPVFIFLPGTGMGCGDEMANCYQYNYCDPSVNTCTDGKTLYDCIYNTFTSGLTDFSTTIDCIEAASEQTVQDLAAYLLCMNDIVASGDYGRLMFDVLPGGRCYDKAVQIYGPFPQPCDVTGTTCTITTCQDLMMCPYSAFSGGQFTLNMYPLIGEKCYAKANAESVKKYNDTFTCIANACSTATDMTQCMTNIQSDPNHPCTILMYDCYGMTTP